MTGCRAVQQGGGGASLDPIPLAAYGLVFAVDVPGGVEPAAGWQPVEVVRCPARPCPIDGPFLLDEERAVMAGRDGWIELSRDGGAPVVRCFGEGIDDDALVHPYLALPASVLNHWLGHLSLHAGAVVVDGVAVALLASKAGGKSTTVVAAALAGIPVVTDDLLVVRDGSAMAGPRSADLREDAAGRVDARPLGRVGARPRWRMELAPVPPEVPLGAVVELVWGDSVTARPLGTDERLDLLARSAALAPAAVLPERILDLLGLPAFRLSRPQDPACLPEVLDAVARLAR